MLGSTYKVVRNAASKIANQTRSAARRREPRLSSIQMFTTDSDRPTPIKHVVLNQDLLQRALTLHAKKTEEYDDTLKAIADLEAEKAKLSQETKQIEKEIKEELGEDVREYKFLDAFCRGEIKSKSFQKRYGYSSDDIEDDTIALCVSLMEDLLRKEEDLRLTEQDIVAKEQRLAKTQDKVDDHEAEVRRLSILISRTQPERFLSFTSDHLPRIADSKLVFKKNRTDISNLKNYPASPAKVRPLLVESFVDYCDRKGYIETLNELQYTANFQDIFKRMSNKKEFSNEATVTAAFDQVMFLVTEAMTDEFNEKVPYEVSIYTADQRYLKGRSNFSFASKKVDGSRIPLIVGETKGPGKEYSYDNLGETYCDHGCPGCESERHKNHSVVRQLYGYMLLNGLLVGVYSNYKVTCVFIRDCEGNLMITNSVRAEEVGDIARGKLSSMQLVALAILLAADTSEMNFSEIENNILVPCLGGREISEERIILPSDCRGSNNLENDKHGNTYSVNVKKLG